MDLIQQYWWVIVIVVALVLAFILLRPRQRVTLTDSTPLRPHMAKAKSLPEGRGIAGEAAAATSDVTGEILHVPVRQTLDGEEHPHDDLCRLKGVGPKFADALRALGFNRYERIARLTPNEVALLDRQLGAFSGRLTRDQIVEQADYLARGDTDGFEHRFGKL